MGVIIGIDVGGSTTKIIGILDDNIIEPILIHAKDPITSLFGAFGKFLHKNKINIASVSRIMITGVGATFINEDIYGIKTYKVPEFDANALGGLYLSNKKNAIVVSLGTGTSIVIASETDNKYIGGTAVGGGTIVGLCKKMIDVYEIDKIVELAKTGDITKIDLSVSDIVSNASENIGLHKNLTASNFGKINTDCSINDIALGVLNLVFQSIAMTTAFASFNTTYKDIVLIGNLSKIDICQKIFKDIENIAPVNYIFPNMSEYATALGAVLYKNY